MSTALLAGLAFLLAGPAPAGGPTSGRWRGQALGVCWEGSPRPIEAAVLEPLGALGANALSQTPFAFMRDPERPELGFGGFAAGEDARGGWWGERPEGVRFLARAARERGIATLLKPHVWLHGSWPGEIAMGSEADWQTWFAAYREFLLQWARFAAQESLEGLCIGNELDLTVGHEREWRALIAEVRALYPGLLTYAANWTHFEEVPFWDALDAIGVNAYFPLSTAEQPTVGELIEAWEPIHARLERLSARHGLPVVFTEIGYRPLASACARPWESEGETAPDPLAQAHGYEAALRVFLGEPWFGGCFVWKWHASREDPRPRRHTSFSPQGLPAEETLRGLFQAARRP